MEIPSSDEVTAQRSSDFQAWTSLISKVESIHYDDIDKISLVYDPFLSEFPLCYGYWKKYADHKARLCGIEDAVKVFEQAVELAPYSVDMWVEYCNFGISSFEDPNDVCRLFEKGLLLVGKDYLCYKIWDKYIEFEFSQQHWNSLANIYIQTLKFPTKKLHEYYESFTKLVAIWEEEMRCQGIPFTNKLSEKEIIGKIKKLKNSEISCAISDLLDSSTRSKALLKYRHIGEQFYQRACELESKITQFEQNIRRPYFHVKPLDENQLKNWHQYLNFAEAEGDFDWAVKLYERCLISCANYPEFWMRYADYLDSKGAREIATDALERATCVFLKNAPQIHLFNAWFKEEVSDVDGLRAAFEQCDQHYESYLSEYVRRKANMERRLGNYTAASNIYKEALDLAAEKRPDMLPMLYLHFSRLQLMITNNVDAAKEVLLKGIQCLPRSKLLLEELILFAFMHKGAMQVETLDSIMAKALTFESDASDGLTAKECEDISRLYLEFVDFCGSIHDVRRAWNRHLKLFPHFVRVDYSLRKPSKASTFWKLINDGEKDTPDSLPQNSIGNCVENHLEEKVLEEPITGHGEQEMEDQVEMLPSEVAKTQTRGALGEDELSDKAMKDSFHHDQDRDELKPSSLDNPKDIDDAPKISGALSPRGTIGGRENWSPGPTLTQSHKNSSREASPNRNSEREGDCSRLNPSGKGRPNVGSPSISEERRERSSSPRRRSHGYSDDRRHRDRSLSPRRHRDRSFSPRRHRDRSLSPRRHNSRWNSDERWHRDRRHRRNFRYQDISRGRRDGRMQNENQVVVIGNAGQMPNFQQQGPGFSGQTQVSAQVGTYPQGQINPSPSNEQVGSLQNNSQLYNQMWQYYYYNQQQQQLLQQQPPYQQQQQQQLLQPQQQIQQPIQNPPQQVVHASQQQPQQINSQPQQLSNLQYQQHMLSQLPQFQQLQQQQSQQPPSNDQPPSQEQQLQLYLQMQQQQVQTLQQPQVQHQDEMDPQKQQQQQQQAYQYQQLQQQQYLLYLQQLQQYQYLQQQQPGLVKDQKSAGQQQQLPAKQEGHEEDKSQSEPRHLVDPRSSNCQKGAEVEGSQTSISPGVGLLPQDQVEELEELDIVN